MNSKKSVVQKLDDVKSRHDLVLFIKVLAEDLTNNPDSWTNNKLPNFLEALSAWVEDMDGYYQSEAEQFSEDQNWKGIAEALYAAKIYE